MSPNQLAYLLLANPDFAKQAGVMDWVKQKAAPLALAGSMGLVGGAAGSHLNQAITSSQPEASSAQTPEVAVSKAMNMARAAGNPVSDAPPTRLQPGEAMHPMTEPGPFPPTPPEEAAAASFADKYPTLSNIPNRISDVLGNLREVSSRVARVPGDLKQVMQTDKRVQVPYGDGSWPYERKTDRGGQVITSPILDRVLGGSKSEIQQRRDLGPIPSKEEKAPQAGSSLAEQRRNEANLEKIDKLRLQAEKAERATKKQMPRK